MRLFVLVGIAVALIGCAKKAEPPRMPREAALKMIADSMWVFPMRVVEWQDAEAIVVYESFMDDPFDGKVRWCSDVERARRLVGLSADFFIIDDTNHKRLGQWKNGKLTIY